MIIQMMAPGTQANSQKVLTGEDQPACLIGSLFFFR
jgi:hypothetical protein